MILSHFARFRVHTDDTQTNQGELTSSLIPPLAQWWKDHCHGAPFTQHIDVNFSRLSDEAALKCEITIEISTGAWYSYGTGTTELDAFLSALDQIEFYSLERESSIYLPKVA